MNIYSVNIRLIFGKWTKGNESCTHYCVTRDGKLVMDCTSDDISMSYELAERWESQYKYMLKDIIESIYISY
ncbi:MAG: hypothetical protein R3Y32_00220 [Bacillota bacterium]